MSACRVKFESSVSTLFFLYLIVPWLRAPLHFPYLGDYLHLIIKL